MNEKSWKEKWVMYLYAETPMHPGSETTLGVVDLPIQREKHTEFPMIQGSSVKGVLRSCAREFGIDENLFGKEGEESERGDILTTDARILAFPVRSLKGLFGWITCPFVINRLKRDLTAIEKADEAENLSDSLQVEYEKTLVPEDSNLVVDQNSIYIEDLKLTSQPTEEAKKIAEFIANNAFPDGNSYQQLKEKFKKSLVVVNDDLFRDVTKMTTEIITRIKIGENGVVEKGGLWTEEHLPTDTLMYTLVFISNNVKKEVVDSVFEKYNNSVLNFGGDETTGKGFARIKILR